MKTVQINPIGTAWEGNTYECIHLYHIYYAPEQHLVFYPMRDNYFGWDNAIFPDWDRMFEKEKKIEQEREKHYPCKKA